MARYSRRNRKGGDKLDDIQVQVDRIQQELNELKGSPSSSMSEPMSEPMSESMSEPMSESMSEPMSEPMSEFMPEESVKVDKTWVTDKDKKFRDGAGGRVSLAFSRIMTLIDEYIKKKGDTKKGNDNWSTIKQKLVDANSVGEVQDVIDTYKISFASNYVAGTRRRKRHSKKRTNKRR
jgi:hypothetical protein